MNYFYENQILIRIIKIINNKVTIKIQIYKIYLHFLIERKFESNKNIHL